MLKVKTHGFRYSRVRRHDDEPMVQDGLSVTPKQMEELAMLGRPVSTMTLGAEYYDNTKPNDFSVTPECQRGAGFIECWESDKNIESKVRKAAAHYRSAKQAQVQTQELG